MNRTALDMAVALGQAALLDVDRIDAMNPEELLTFSKEAVAGLLHLSAAIINEHHQKEKGVHAKD